MAKKTAKKKRRKKERVNNYYSHRPSGITMRSPTGIVGRPRPALVSREDKLFSLLKEIKKRLKAGRARTVEIYAHLAGVKPRDVNDVISQNASRRHILFG